MKSLEYENTGVGFYNAACYLALLGRGNEALISLDKAIFEFSDEQDWRSIAEKDSDFDEIRNNAEFKSLMNGQRIKNEQNNTESKETINEKSEKAVSKNDSVQEFPIPSINKAILSKNIQDVYGFDMPADFYRFIDFCGDLYNLGIAKKETSGELTDSINSLFETAFDISLGVIFNLLQSNFKVTTYDPISNERYYDDPPEFFTILCGHTDGLHWGYWVDEPAIHPFRVCHYYHSDSYEFNDDGETIFDALINHMNNLFEDDLEPKSEKALKKIKPVLKKYLVRNKEKKREATMAFYDLGIVVPKEKYQQPANKLYTALVENFIQSKIPENSQLEPLIKEVISLSDAGFPGAAYALGKRLWCDKNNRAQSILLLEKAYSSLGRTALLNSLKKANDFRTKCDESCK
jgi:hypothetical protein